ncbi:MAG: hypothetical protein ACI9C4_001336 [Paraglaciecola sp.]|jgi:hypothetical protein
MKPMDHEQHIRASASAIIAALKDRVTWKYDGFNNALLAEFSADKELYILPIIHQHLPGQWDAKKVKQAPPLMIHLAGKFAKINKKQKLFYPHSTEPPQVMLAWWPWGHGATISIRLFVVNQEPFVPKISLLKRWCSFFT